MPPKPKFTREQVLEAALKIVREKGEDALTARNLGTELGSSTRPLFTLFDSMDEIKTELLKGPAINQFGNFSRSFKDFTPAFKRFGMMLVNFAETEPNLFSFLFISKHVEGLTLREWSSSEIGEEALSVLMHDYQLDEETAEVLFQETWLHTFSICVLKVTGAVMLSEEEVSDSLSRHFIGLMGLAKSGRLLDKGITPQAGGMPGGLDVSAVPYLS